MTNAPARESLGKFSSLARSALCAATLEDMVDALATALAELGLIKPATPKLTRTLRDATRLTVQRVASGAGSAAEMSRLRRMLRMISPAAAASDAAVDVWMELAHEGAAALRRAYLGSLLQSARELAGGNAVALSDLSGERVPVQASGKGNRESVSERVASTAQQILDSAVSACRASGVFGMGRFRMTRLDRPSHTMLDGVVDFRLSPTGLPVVVIRTHSYEAGGPLPTPVVLAESGSPVGFEAQMALRVAG